MLARMPKSIKCPAVDELLRRYGITPPGGTPALQRLQNRCIADLGGHRRDDGRKMVTVTVGNISESRPCPFADGESRRIVRRLCNRHLIPRHDDCEKRLEELLDRAAEMFANEQLDSFVFEGVVFQDGAYRIGSVHMVRSAD
jgi:hypothetical protein